MRLIPLDGDLAEIVFALGAGDSVVATDLSATHPPAADALPEVGYQRALSPEPILQFEPTLALHTDIAGPAETLDALERVGVEVVRIPTDPTPDGPGEKIRAVAAAIGVEDVGNALAARVDAEIAAASGLAAGIEAEDRPRVAVLYLRGEGVQLLFGEGSDVDWVIEAAGAFNVADDLGVDGNAPITAESLVLAAPDVLVVTEDGLESVGGLDGLLEIPGVAETPAGASRRVLAYDAQYLLGNGPRTGALLAELIHDVHGLDVAGRPGPSPSPSHHQEEITP